MQYVVTYRMEPRNPTAKNGERLVVRTVEFFRGSKGECLRIAKAFGGGEDDKTRSNPWQVMVGHAEDWDDLFDDDG